MLIVVIMDVVNFKKVFMVGSFFIIGRMATVTLIYLT